MLSHITTKFLRLMLLIIPPPSPSTLTTRPLSAPGPGSPLPPGRRRRRQASVSFIADIITAITTKHHHHYRPFHPNNFHHWIPGHRCCSRNLAACLFFIPNCPIITRLRPALYPISPSIVIGSQLSAFARYLPPHTAAATTATTASSNNGQQQQQVSQAFNLAFIIIHHTALHHFARFLHLVIVIFSPSSSSASPISSDQGPIWSPSDRLHRQPSSPVRVWLHRPGHRHRVSGLAWGRHHRLRSFIVINSSSF